MYCVACGRTGVDRCHIKSRGAGGGDEDMNIIYLCRQHHSMQHQYGWKRFTEKHPKVLLELQARGFYFDEFNRLRK